jgi:glutamine amidotransferase-like uncharacterized protein
MFAKSMRWVIAAQFVFLCSVHALGVHADDLIRVALFDDVGSTGKGVPLVTEQLSKQSDVRVVKVKGVDIANAGLKDYDVVLFTGGSASKQSATLGRAGCEEVRRFVRDGGGYLGICAGAYLALSGSEKWLGLVDGKTKSHKWQRGSGKVEMEVLPLGKDLTGLPVRRTDIRYVNGPVFAPANQDEIPDFETLALFRTELAKNDSPAGIMVDSPAMVRGSFGKGRVLISSPHPEQTAGMEHVVERAVRWLAGNDQSSLLASE